MSESKWRTRNGFTVFSLVGDGLWSNTGRATRRERANAALIRHRQRRYPNMDTCTTAVWEGIVAWRLAWENEIYSYRDGNANDSELEKGQDDD